ncbi:GDSL-type esterase/lipase family protein [Leptolyngbyaceae cyanobacterium UHCC 1019]
MQTAKLPTLQKTTHPLRIIAVGDSIIYGFGDPAGGGWIERLRRSWMIPGSLGHALYNLGVRGDGVQQVATRLESEFRLRGELRNRVPDLLILSVGTNDSARLSRPDGRNFTDFNLFCDEMERLLDQAVQLCPVMFVGMVPVDEAKMPFLDCLYYNQADQFRYKEATRLACEARQIPYLDVFSQWQLQSSQWLSDRLTEDGLHPNVMGYETLLDQVLTWQAFHEQVAAMAPCLA